MNESTRPDRDQQNIITVGLAQLKVSCDPAEVLAAMGLGSCVGVCAYDPVAKVAGMLHAVLPERGTRMGGSPTKFVDTGIPSLLNEMLANGASYRRLVIRMAGGAQMLIAPGFKNILDIGARNVEMARTVIKKEGLRCVGEETGGNRGRTVKLYVKSGKLTVRSIGRGERDIPIR